MDWTDCPLIERVPGKVSGAPVIKHARVRAEDLVVNRAEGEDWLADAYDLPLTTVRDVLAFHERYKSQRSATHQFRRGCDGSRVADPKCS